MRATVRAGERKQRHGGDVVRGTTEPGAGRAPGRPARSGLARWAAAGALVLGVSLAADAEGREPTTYSPYVDTPPPTRVLWGDTHLHTHNSLDARAFGVTLGPREAYRFARGEEVVATHGQRARLARPLDFLVVTDHSDGIGAMKELIRGNPALLGDPRVRDWRARLGQGHDAAMQVAIEVVLAFTEADIPEVLIDPAFTRSVWQDFVEIADAHDRPGRFSAMIGYEWTPTEDGNNLHRNVIYRDGAERARQVLPFTTFESFAPEALWRWMARYEAETGGRVLAIPHNGNVSNGIMFPVHRSPSRRRGVDRV